MGRGASPSRRRRLLRGVSAGVLVLASTLAVAGSKSVEVSLDDLGSPRLWPASDGFWLVGKTRVGRKEALVRVPVDLTGWLGPATPLKGLGDGWTSRSRQACGPEACVTQGLDGVIILSRDGEAALLDSALGLNPYWGPELCDLNRVGSRAFQSSPADSSTSWLRVEGLDARNLVSSCDDNALPEERVWPERGTCTDYQHCAAAGQHGIIYAWTLVGETLQVSGSADEPVPSVIDGPGQYVFVEFLAPDRSPRSAHLSVNWTVAGGFVVGDRVGGHLVGTAATTDGFVVVQTLGEGESSVTSWSPEGQARGRRPVPMSARAVCPGPADMVAIVGTRGTRDDGSPVVFAYIDAAGGVMGPWEIPGRPPGQLQSMQCAGSGSTLAVLTAFWDQETDKSTRTLATVSAEAH